MIMSIICDCLTTPYNYTVNLRLIKKFNAYFGNHREPYIWCNVTKHACF